MSTASEDRRARKMLSSDPEANRIVSILESFEVGTEGFFAKTSLYESVKFAVAEKHLDLITFSCLGSFAEKEKLRLSIFDTFFFRDRKKVKIIGALLEALNTECPDTPSVLKVFLPDMEPRRTWGWNVLQEDISFVCEMMVEEDLPPYIEAHLWSEVDDKCEMSFENALRWLDNPIHAREQALIVSQEAEHLGEFDIHFPGGPKAAAKKQVAAYAREGLILHRVFPQGILVQSEYPVARKDRMFQPLLAPKALPIIHPFEFEERR